MIVKIRFPQGRRLQHRRGTNRELSAAFGALLVPASLMAYSLGFWRLASDMGLAGQFDITGIFSHWQVWIGLGVILHTAGDHSEPVRPGRRPGDAAGAGRIARAARSADEDELEHQSRSRQR